MVEAQYIQELNKFGENLKSIRKAKGMTQLDLALEMKIERSEISKIENGRLNIEFRTIVKLAIALDTDISSLFAKKPE